MRYYNTIAIQCIYVTTRSTHLCPASRFLPNAVQYRTVRFVLLSPTPPTNEPTNPSVMDIPVYRHCIAFTHLPTTQFVLQSSCIDEVRGVQAQSAASNQKGSFQTRPGICMIAIKFSELINATDDRTSSVCHVQYSDIYWCLPESGE
jgi:hypothetical protein